MKKTDARKRALAAWIKGQSTMGNAWLADRLHMGRPAHAAAALDEEIRTMLENTNFLGLTLSALVLLVQPRQVAMLAWELHTGQEPDLRVL